MDMQLTETKNQTEKVCIIGAGSSGLAAAKTFSERGIPFDCLERENDIGGLWNETTNTGVVYDTTYLVSSKKYTDFEDYPMPEEYPTYPSHREALAYLRDYAQTFGILDRIQFNTIVESAERTDEGWRVRRGASPPLPRPRDRHRPSRHPARAENTGRVHRRDHAFALLSQRPAARRQTRRRGRSRQFGLRHRRRCDERGARRVSKHAARHLFRAKIHAWPANRWHRQFL